MKWDFTFDISFLHMLQSQKTSVECNINKVLEIRTKITLFTSQTTEFDAYSAVPLNCDLKL